MGRDLIAWVEWLTVWLARGLGLVAAVTLAFGAFSALAPQRSIALYQRLMARFNWRVEPIDAAHEVRMTRWLGWLLVGLALVVFWRLATVPSAWAMDEPTGGGTAVTKSLQKATFAGGCFWCMEPPFSHLAGVITVMPGYTGGMTANPTYEQVSSGTTGHAEAVEILFDPAKVTYAQLLETFWMNIDPTQADGQFADRGSQYRTAIFTHTEEQAQLARESKERLAQSGKFSKPIVTEIVRATTFYPAEDYHREYYKKNPTRYQLYKAGSGREGFLHRTWGEAAEQPGAPR